MILFNMDYPTIFRQMQKEQEKVQYALQKSLKKVTTMKQGKLLSPHYFYDTVTMKDSNNTYLLYWNIPDFEAFYYDDYKSREKNMVNGAILLAKDNQGLQYGITCRWYKTQKKAGDEIKLMDGINVFTPHFFSRYRERMEFPKDYTQQDVIAAFSCRNLNYFVQLDYDMVVLEKNRQENGNATAVKDGIMLGEGDTIIIDNKPVMVVRAKTFLSEKEFKEDQAKVNPSKTYVWNMAKEMFKQYNNYDFDKV